MTPDFDRVDLVELSRRFGRRRAVWKVTFAAQARDIIGLLGPNGAGKSTLIGMLATLVAPTSGTLRFGAADQSGDGAAVRARIGLLAHELHLYPELTARQNLTFFARLYGLDAATLVPAALEAAGLSERADDDVSSFSRGMRQRLALERALLHQPRLLLLDEPFTGLDDRAVTLVSSRLRELAAAGAIVIVATHDLDLADGLVTRVALIRDGKLVADEPATPGLRHRYRSLLSDDVMGLFFNTALLVLKKDFAIELKSREIVYTTLLFALSCILIFSLTFVVEGQPLAEAASGIVWIAIAFSGTLALGRTFERERYSETLRALMLAPAPRAAIYVGKLLGMVTLLVAAEALIVPLVSVLFQANLVAQLPLLAPLLLLGTSDSRVSARCSPPCSSARGRATCCCPSCCIRLRFRS